MKDIPSQIGGEPRSIGTHVTRWYSCVVFGDNLARAQCDGVMVMRHVEYFTCLHEPTRPWTSLDRRVARTVVESHTQYTIDGAHALQEA